MQEHARRNRRYYTGSEIERHREPEQADVHRVWLLAEPLIVHCKDETDGGEGHRGEMLAVFHQRLLLPLDQLLDHLLVQDVLRAGRRAACADRRSRHQITRTTLNGRPAEAGASKLATSASPLVGQS